MLPHYMVAVLQAVRLSLLQKTDSVKIKGWVLFLTAMLVSIRLTADLIINFNMAKAEKLLITATLMDLMELIQVQLLQQVVHGDLNSMVSRTTNIIQMYLAVSLQKVLHG